MEKLQKKVVRCVGKAHYLEHTLPLFKKLQVLKFQDIFELQTLKQMLLYFHNIIPQLIRDLSVRNEAVHHYNTRQRSNPRVHK